LEFCPHEYTRDFILQKDIDGYSCLEKACNYLNPEFIQILINHFTGDLPHEIVKMEYIKPVQTILDSYNFPTIKNANNE